MLYHKIIFIIALIFSFVIHHVIFFSLTSSNTTKNPAEQATKPKPPAFSMKIGNPVEVKKTGQADTKPSAPPQPENSMPPKIDSKVQEKIPSDKTLRKLGQSVIGKVKKGEFPPLIINYENPEKYLTEMTELGARLLLFDELHQKLWEISIPAWKAQQFRLQHLRNFSPFKRVVKDEVFKKKRVRLSQELDLDADDTQLVLLVPMDTELEWIGYQLHVFRKTGLQSNQIASVKGTFQDSRLKIKSLTLMDKSVKRIG